MQVKLRWKCLTVCGVEVRDLEAAFEEKFSAMKVLDWSQLQMFDYVGSQQQNSAFQQSEETINKFKAIQSTMTL